MAELLSACALLCSLAICLRLLTYRPAPGTRRRCGVAWCAWLLIVCTGGQGLQILLQGVHATTSIWQLGLLLFLLFVTYRVRGNVARLFRAD